MQIQDFGTKRDKYYFYNNLTCIVKSLEKLHTVIDLRNESCVSGLITHVDGLMNVEMESVTYYDPLGRIYKFQNFFISARNIRYVHIPEGLSCESLIQGQLNALSRVQRGEPSKAKRSFKAARAKRYNEAILREVYESQPSTSKEK